MRDLFSGCAYVRTYVAVTLRNVNLRSCLGMSIYANPQESGVTETCITRGRRWRMELGGTFLGDGGRGGQHSWAFTMCVFGGVKCRNEC